MNLSPITIDWTNATENLLTTGTGRFDGKITVGSGSNDGSTISPFILIDTLATGTDAKIEFYLNTVAKWTMGVDDSDGDKFKIGQADLGTSDAFEIDTSGNFEFNSGNFTGVGTITGGAYNDATIAGSASQVEFSSNSGVNFWSSEGVNFIAGQADGFVLCGKASGATSRDLTVTGADITLDAATQTGWGTSLTHVTSNGTDHSYIDQSVVIAASPTFAGLTVDNINLNGNTINATSGDLLLAAAGGDIGTTNRMYIGSVASALSTRTLNVADSTAGISYTGFNQALTTTNYTIPAMGNVFGVNFTVSWAPGGDPPVSWGPSGLLSGALGSVSITIPNAYTKDVRLANMYGFSSSLQIIETGSPSGTITVDNAYIYRAPAASVSGQGAMTNLYAFYDAGQTAGGTNWGLAINTQSYINANLSIGKNTTPSVALDVTGAALISTTLGVTGNFAVNTNKFTVTAASGNTLVAGTLDATGDFKVNTNKFTVAAASGNTLVAGTLGVTGVATFSDNVIINSDTASLQLGAGQDIYLYSDTDAELSIKGDDGTKDIKLLFESGNEGSITWMEDELRFDFDGHIQIQKDSGTAPFIKINSTLSGAGDQVYIETNYDSDGVPIRARLESKQGLAQVGTFTLHDLDVVTNSVTRMTVSAAGYVRVINRLKVGADSVPAQPLDVAGVSLLRDKLAFTQTDLNEYIDSLADGYMDYGATTAHRFNTTVEIATKIKLTAIGGYAVKLTNETGGNTVAGQVVKADTATNDAVILTAADEFESLGVFLDSGVADASEAWVVVAGIADIAMEDNTTATRGNWVRTSVTEAGYADATNAAPPGAGITEIDRHLHEIGHCIETVTAGGGGTHILARCVIHFN